MKKEYISLEKMLILWIKMYDLLDAIASENNKFASGSNQHKAYLLIKEIREVSGNE